MLSACLPRAKYLLADKAYDANHWRDHLKARRIQPVIPNKSNRVQLRRFNKARYKGWNVNERMSDALRTFVASPPGAIRVLPISSPTCTLQS